MKGAVQSGGGWLMRGDGGRICIGDRFRPMVDSQWLKVVCT